MLRLPDPGGDAVSGNGVIRTCVATLDAQGRGIPLQLEDSRLPIAQVLQAEGAGQWAGMGVVVGLDIDLQEAPLRLEGRPQAQPAAHGAAQLQVTERCALAGARWCVAHHQRGEIQPRPVAAPRRRGAPSAAGSGSAPG